MVDSCLKRKHCEISDSESDENPNTCNVSTILYIGTLKAYLFIMKLGRKTIWGEFIRE